MFASAIKPGRSPLEGEIHLVLVPLQGLRGDRLEGPQGVLSEEERDRARAIHHPATKGLFLATRSALRCLLGGCLGVDPKSLAWSYNDKGKPRLWGSAENKGLVFNVSHSGDHALIAIGWDLKIGVDIEKVRPRKALESLAKAIMTPQEESRWQMKEEESRTASLVATWASKEAFLKATGQGIAGGLKSVAIRPGFEGFERVPPSEGSPDLWQLHLEALNDFRWALAYQGPRHRIVGGWFDLFDDAPFPS
jgi:4'-phosphopantetheinyl transferase